jgi:hypothetical protein
MLRTSYVEETQGNRYHGRIQTLLDEFTLVEAQIGSRRLGFVSTGIYKAEWSAKMTISESTHISPRILARVPR